MSLYLHVIRTDGLDTGDVYGPASAPLTRGPHGLLHEVHVAAKRPTDMLGRDRFNPEHPCVDVEFKHSTRAKPDDDKSTIVRLDRKTAAALRERLEMAEAYHQRCDATRLLDDPVIFEIVKDLDLQHPKSGSSRWLATVENVRRELARDGKVSTEARALLDVVTDAGLRALLEDPQWGGWDRSGDAEVST